MEEHAGKQQRQKRLFLLKFCLHCKTRQWQVLWYYKTMLGNNQTKRLFRTGFPLNLSQSRWPLRSDLFCFQKPDARPKCGFRGLSQQWGVGGGGVWAVGQRCEHKTERIDWAELKCGIDHYGIYWELRKNPASRRRDCVCPVCMNVIMFFCTIKTVKEAETKCSNLFHVSSANREGTGSCASVWPATRGCYRWLDFTFKRWLSGFSHFLGVGNITSPTQQKHAPLSMNYMTAAIIAFRGWLIPSVSRYNEMHLII